MTHVTFGMSASSFAANMSVKRNAMDHVLELPKVATAVETTFYVDDCLCGAHSVQEPIDVHQQLLRLFARGGFLPASGTAVTPKSYSIFRLSIETHIASVVWKSTRKLLEWRGVLTLVICI